jgi:nitrite reductase/ring-hydroxylating ferredoxin subunit
MRPFDDINELERAEWLDKPAAVVRSVVQRVLRHQGVKDALHGVWLGHPLHPGAAQFALGSFTSAALLDAMRGPQSASSRLIVAGLAATAPTVASGWADWGDAHEDQQRVGLVHAATNGTAVALFVAALTARARGRSGRLASVAGGVVAGVGALLGGHLGYRQALGANHAEAITHIGPADWQPLGPLVDLPENTPIRRRAGAVDVVVVRRGNDVTTLADACSHLAAPLSDGELIDVDGDPKLVCPWHGSQFRLADGCVVHGPATASAPRFETRLSGGVVEARVVRIPGVDAAPGTPEQLSSHGGAGGAPDTGVARHAGG